MKVKGTDFAETNVNSLQNMVNFKAATREIQYFAQKKITLDVIQSLRQERLVHMVCRAAAFPEIFRKIKMHIRIKYSLGDMSILQKDGIKSFQNSIFPTDSKRSRDRAPVYLHKSV
jgi:hypothetical protein